MANQFANPANPRIHYETTAPELWAQMDGRIDAFVYGSGTGGTISGVGRFLKERNPARSSSPSSRRGRPCCRAVSAASISSRAWAPASSRRISTARVVDRVVQAWEEDAFPLARRLAREEGLFVGMSSGAIAWAALQIARELGPGRRVAMIAPDSGARYLSTSLVRGAAPGPVTVVPLTMSPQLKRRSGKAIPDSLSGSVVAGATFVACRSPCPERRRSSVDPLAAVVAESCSESRRRPAAGGVSRN